MLEVEKMSQNSPEKQDVDIADFRSSPRLPAHLHVQFHDSFNVAIAPRISHCFTLRLL